MVELIIGYWYIAIPICGVVFIWFNILFEYKKNKGFSKDTLPAFVVSLFLLIPYINTIVFIFMLFFFLYEFIDDKKERKKYESKRIKKKY